MLNRILTFGKFPIRSSFILASFGLFSFVSDLSAQAPVKPTPPSLGAAPTSSLGVAARFGPNEPDFLIDDLETAGITFIRTSTDWNKTEQTKGVFTFSEPDRNWIRLAKSQGRRVVMNLNGENKEHGVKFPNSPAQRDLFARFCARTVEFFGDDVSYYEIWNEWTAGTGIEGGGDDNSPSNYKLLLKTTTERIRSLPGGNSKYIIGIGGESSRANQVKIQAMIDAPNSVLDNCDAISVHSYRHRLRDQSPEGFDLPSGQPSLRQEIQTIANMIPQAKNHRIWITEIGWPTNDLNADDFLVSYIEQMQYLVRSYAILSEIQSGGKYRVEKMINFELMDKVRNTPRIHDNNFGIVNFVGETASSADKKPSYFGLKTLMTMLANQSFDKRLDGWPNKTFGYQFKRAPGDDVVIAWNAGAGEVAIPASLGNITAIYDWRGNRITPISSAKLTKSPIYIFRGQ
jgi:hypothetical protein